MASTIKIKRSAVQGKVPATGDLQLGELAVNTYDGKLFTKKDNGTATVVEIGASAQTIAEFKRTIDSDYTLTTGSDGLSFGSIEVAAGYTVTIPENASWTVLS